MGRELWTALTLKGHLEVQDLEQKQAQALFSGQGGNHGGYRLVVGHFSRFSSLSAR